MSRLHAVPFTQVTITDRFWAPRRAVNRTVTLAHALDQLETSGTVRNLELAAAGAREGFQGYVFQDSDVYKTIEAVSYSLATDPDPALDARVDALIAKVAAAQLPDGYLNSHFSITGLDKRWTNLRDRHEMYCAGHLFEAAVAHYQATGKRALLDIALRCAEHIDQRFGEGRQPGYAGHPEIELALFRLWRVTDDPRWFELARFLLVHRGERFFAHEHQTPLDAYDGHYWQDNVPLAEHREIVGHAVRAGYLFAAVTDLVAETGDAALWRMLRRVWGNTVERRMFVTGGIGSSGSNEGFTTDYDLPNLTAYQETCASIALAMWAQRLNLHTGDGHYADHVELALYNAVLAGVSLDGTRFFYDNPLASAGYHHRREWFGCACCPPNLARTLAALGGYAYACDDAGLVVNLYIQGSVTTRLAGVATTVAVTTDYPWDGQVTLDLAPASAVRAALRLRVPGWCQGARVRVNGAPVAAPVVHGYCVLEREWAPGDRVELDLPLAVRRIEAHPLVKDDRGALAVMRGPLVYCVEDTDHDTSVATLALPADAVLTPRAEPDLLGGVVTLHGPGLATAQPEWSGGLYREAVPPRPVAVKLVPYYAWDNRAGGAQRVWLPTAPPPPVGGGPERHATIAVSFQVGHSQPHGLNDGLEPANSHEEPPALCHFWPHKGGEEWAEYTWPAPLTLERSRVYWYDDTGRGACRPPAAWRLEWRDGDEWRPVTASGPYPVALDQWCAVAFVPVTTAALRLVITQQDEWSVGLHEWQVGESEEL